MADIKLYNGDCLKIMDKLIADGVKIDSVIADIPYFKVVKNSWDNFWKNKQEYFNWVEKCIDKLNMLIPEKGSIILFTGRQYNKNISMLLEKYFTEQRIIIWARKRSFNNTRGKALSSGYEPICYYTRNEYTFNNIKLKVDSNRPEYKTGYLKDGVNLSDVWTDISALPHNAKEKVDHPTQKPIQLMERCVLMTTNEGDTVLDFTMGSGTTGVACKKLNRNFIGIELDEKYFKIAKERIENIIEKLEK